jgi:hypothetical protein
MIEEKNSSKEILLREKKENLPREEKYHKLKRKNFRNSCERSKLVSETTLEK